MDWFKVLACLLWIGLYPYTWSTGNALLGAGWPAINALVILYLMRLITRKYPKRKPQPQNRLEDEDPEI